MNTVKELEVLKQMLELKNFEDCVGFAKQRFYEDHQLQITKLIDLFPEEHKDSEGNKFWSGPKRFPDPIEFDAEDELHLDYMVSCSNLMAQTLDIEPNEDRDEIAEMAIEADVDDDVEAEEIDIEGDEEAKKAAGKSMKSKGNMDEAKEKVDELAEEMEEFDENEEDDINPAEFEKDDDTNFHIDFIHAAANLRARNYRLEECDKFKSKMIAGKIVPAIATTTATIVGSVCIELIKYIQGFKKISDYRNTYLSLAVNQYVQNEPVEPKKNQDVEMDPILFMPVKAVPQGWTIWDTIVIKGSQTVKKLIKEVSKIAESKSDYKIEINLVTCGSKTIYTTVGKKEKIKERLSKKVEEAYEEIIGEEIDSNYLELSIGGTTEDGDEISMPQIKYVFKTK